MKNVVELRRELADVFVKLKRGEIDHKNASEMANIAGKMINSAKLELEYSALRKENPNIDFLKN